MAFSLHLNKKTFMLKGAVNFQSLSKLANANINRACWIGGDTEIRRGITLDTHKFNDTDTNKSKTSAVSSRMLSHQTLY